MISLPEAAKRLSLHPSRVRALCAQGRIPGAQKIGRNWILPEKPQILVMSLDKIVRK